MPIGLILSGNNGVESGHVICHEWISVLGRDFGEHFAHARSMGSVRYRTYADTGYRPVNGV